MTKQTPSSGISWWLKWVATGTIIISGITAAVGHVPLNFLIGSIGSYLWLAVGMMWRDRSIMTLNSIMGTLALATYLQGA